MFPKKGSSAVGERLRTARERSGLTQEALAEQLHVTRQTISNWEGGKSLPDIEYLKALAEALNIPIEHLIYAQPPSARGSGRMAPAMADWCRYLGIFVLAAGLLWGIASGSGGVMAADGGAAWGFSWRAALPIWGEAVIRGTILLGISCILTHLQNREP